MNKIFRIINKKSKKLKYSSNIDNYNCHIGQRKLLFSEIEFISYVSKYINIHESLIIYIGASPGMHINILKKIFPDVNFLLYDPLPINLKFKNNIKIINNFFTDSECETVIKYQKELNKKYLIFITDIRSRESEIDNISVWKDMVNQLKWGVLLNADFLSIKFRLPWINEHDNTIYNLDLTDIKNKINNYNIKLENPGDIIYLAGKIYIQIYAHNNSSETRLFVKKNNNKYDLKTYNCYKYEEQLLYHNTINKQLKYKFKLSKHLYFNLIGYNDSYDNVVEYYIIYKYLKYYIKDIKNYNYNIIHILYDISFKYTKDLKNKYIIFCVFYVYIDIINKLKLLFSENELQNNFDSTKINIIINKLQNYITVFKNYQISLNNKINEIKSNKSKIIISYNDLDYMINKIINHNIIISVNNKEYKLLYYNNQFNINFKAIKFINNFFINKLKNL